jgi:hypothetical protein
MPISLLNCLVKLITKALVLRLKGCLTSLIDLDQSGFVRSRCISDSFIYVMEIIQSCKIRKKKVVVLKLDFRKAFDTVSWDYLLRVLQIRGFPRKWISWIHMLTSSAKTTILLNGISGPWIQIRRGLRQGDPFSPLLFLIIVDILQKVIQGFSREGRLNHLLVLDLSCPVIQYVDDTLIIFQRDMHQAHLLKEILDAFSLTTGLSINYDKSTLVSINLDNEEQTQIANILGFPHSLLSQTYLGIPLSDSKLPKWALFPILQSLDKRIDTMAISGATSRGRLILSKSVLSTLPSHILAYIKAPKWFL